MTGDVPFDNLLALLREGLEREREEARRLFAEEQQRSHDLANQCQALISDLSELRDEIEALRQRKSSPCVALGPVEMRKGTRFEDMGPGVRGVKVWHTIELKEKCARDDAFELLEVAFADPNEAAESEGAEAFRQVVDDYERRNAIVEAAERHLVAEGTCDNIESPDADTTTCDDQTCTYCALARAVDGKARE